MPIFNIWQNGQMPPFQHIYDENTLLLLHGEDLTDASQYAIQITNSGATVSADQSKFGGKSLYFDGSSYMKIGISGAAKTVSFWMYPTQGQTSGKYPTPFSIIIPSSTSPTRTYLHQYDGTSSAYPLYRVLKGNYTSGEYGSAIISPNLWHNVEYCFDGSSTHYWFLNGVLQTTLTMGIDVYTELYIGVLALGDRYSKVDANTYFTGYVDEFYVSAECKHTSNFTPPTKPYAR